VEDVETARFLVEHGAVVARQNLEGVSVLSLLHFSSAGLTDGPWLVQPADYLMDEFPEVAEYLHSTLGESSSYLSHATQQQPSQYSQNVTSEALTTQLMSQVQRVVEDAEAEGRDVDVNELTSVVSQSVLEGVIAGYQMTTTNVDDSDIQPAKRARVDDKNDRST
jgi:hypothetical protein